MWKIHSWQIHILVKRRAPNPSAAAEWAKLLSCPSIAVSNGCRLKWSWASAILSFESSKCCPAIVLRIPRGVFSGGHHPPAGSIISWRLTARAWCPIALPRCRVCQELWIDLQCSQSATSLAEDISLCVEGPFYSSVKKIVWQGLQVSGWDCEFILEPHSSAREPWSIFNLVVCLFL